MQSVIEDLLAALNNYSSILKETEVLKVPVQPCAEAATHLNQSSTVARRLSQYQVCAEKLRPHCCKPSDVRALCDVIELNQDLLLHLGTEPDSKGCPSASPVSCSTPPPEIRTISESVQCVDCWSQQVAALRR